MLPVSPILKIQKFPLSSYVESEAKIFLILYTPFENSTTRIAITKGFPTQRQNEPNNHLGSVFDENHTLWEICPEECRPKNHQDWIHC